MAVILCLHFYIAQSLRNVWSDRHTDTFMNYFQDAGGFLRVFVNDFDLIAETCSTESLQNYMDITYLISNILFC